MLSALAGDPGRSVAEALESFAGEDPGRSAALVSLRGPSLAAEVRADSIRPGASLLKLLVVAAVRGAAATGRLDLSARVHRSALPPTRFPSVLTALAAEHELSVNELCGLALVTSDNPASEHLLGLVGRDAVNRHAREVVGLERTRLELGFADELLGPAGRANVTTAREALRLVRQVVTDDSEMAAWLASSLRNERIPLRLPDETRTPHKTGSLQGVANDAGVVFGEETDLALAFLCERQPDTALTGMAIGDCVARIRTTIGESVAW